MKPRNFGDPVNGVWTPSPLLRAFPLQVTFGGPWVFKSAMAGAGVFPFLALRLAQRIPQPLRGACLWALVGLGCNALLSSRCAQTHKVHQAIFSSMWWDGWVASRILSAFLDNVVEDIPASDGFPLKDGGNDRGETAGMTRGETAGMTDG